MTKRRPSNKKPTGANKSLGQSLSNDREKSRARFRRIAKTTDEDLENPALLDVPHSKLNVDSVTEETGLEEFLAKADLANTEFTADRGQVQILSAATRTCVVPVKTSDPAMRALHAHRLKIPRRPLQSQYDSADELIALEKENFLQWRRDLAELQEMNGLVLTPFERNLELWRQLWRVVERSDIVVQIVDARNPLLFRSPDLEAYVRESGVCKQSLLLVNKADLLSPEQMRIWREYFQAEKIHAVFWSAVETAPIGDEHATSAGSSPRQREVHDEVDEEDGEGSGSEWLTEEEEEEGESPNVSSANARKTREDIGDAPYLRHPEDLINLLKRLGKAGDDLRPVVVGMVGYPNVGKSSTINRLIGQKKVPVSAVPGRTRHLQTIIVDSQLTLCDCPGLVIPSFSFSRNEMILNGILPVDQMRDHFSPIDLLLARVPRRYFEYAYSIRLPAPAEHLPSESAPSAHQLLSSLAFARGFMSSSGIPDCSRAARLIIKDVISGRLKWVAAPPTVDQAHFDRTTYIECLDDSTRPSNDVALQQVSLLALCNAQN